MKRSTVALAIVFLAIFAIVTPQPAAADSHVRIVRLSLVQGDVRFARQFHDDPLSDPKAVWESAPLNLPLREGYALATGNGRAEVEFENGAMAFLGNNTVVEFYDLTLHEGGRISRLVLRQGTGIFYVNPTTGDYFSVTGGDFTVEATSRTTFRVDNFDDGSTVNVEKGHVAVLRNEDSVPLDKGQSLSVSAGDTGKGEIARAADPDEFDHWVSGRIDSVVTATNYSNRYVNSPGYTSGFADLYTYGTWYNIAGYGWGWRPFGVGLGWSPFDYGSWYFDPAFGAWSFIGSAPWGWLPYHYGGWVFSPGYGWVWAPAGFGIGGRPLAYRPVTAVWVRSGATMGLVPAHPADVNGKTPLNLTQGVYQVQGNTIGKAPISAAGEEWSVLKQAPKDSLSGSLTAAPSPSRVTRTVLAGTGGSRAVTLSAGSSIVYDAKEHRFVNSANAPNGTANIANNEKGTHGTVITDAKTLTPTTVVGNVPARNNVVPLHTAAPRPAMTPPPASGGGVHGGAVWNGRTGGSSMPSVHTSTGSSGAHPSSGGSRH